MPNFLHKKLAKNEHELAQLSAHLGISFIDPDTPTADKAVQDANVSMEDILFAVFMFKLDKPHVTPQTRMCATCLDEVRHIACMVMVGIRQRRDQSGLPVSTTCVTQKVLLLIVNIQIRAPLFRSVTQEGTQTGVYCA